MFSSLFPSLAYLFLLSLAGTAPSGATALQGSWASLDRQGVTIEFRESNQQLWVSHSEFPDAWFPVSWHETAWYAEAPEALLEFQLLANRLLVTQTSEGQKTTSYFQALESTQTLLARNEAASFRRGAIHGLPVGPAKSTASMFRVYLYRVGAGREFVGSQVLHREDGFSFDGLPEGEYQLVISAQGPTAIQPKPAIQQIHLIGGKVVEQNVVLD